MTSQIRVTIGQARVTVNVEGCVQCGTFAATSWVMDRRHAIRIGDRTEHVTLYICGRCSAAKGRPVEEYEAPTALQRRFATVR